MLVQWLRPFYAEDDGGGGGEDPSTGKLRASDVLQRHGNTAESATRIAELYAEAENKLYSLRDKNRTLREERDGLKAKLPAEGAVVLTKEDAAQLEAYRALGKPEELGKAVTDRDAAQQELGTLRRAETIRSAAEAHGYRAGPLGKLPSLAGKDLLVKEIQEGDAKVKRAFVKDGATETALPDYIAANDPEFLGALAAETQQHTQAGTSYVQQSAGGGKPKPQNAGQAYVQNTKYAVPGKTT